MRTRKNARDRVRAAFARPRLWQLTTGLAALAFCALLITAAQGSVDVIRRVDAVARSGASWPRWCTRGDVREDRVRLAFCARVAGIVLDSRRGPGVGEAHLAVVGGFHLTVVKLPPGSSVPSIGTRIVAVGPLFRARNGQREVQAFWWQPS